MRGFVFLFLMAILAGCEAAKTEPQGKRATYKVTLYSGTGAPVRTIDADAFDASGHSDRWEITEAKTGRHIHLTGTVVIEPADGGATP